MLILLILIHLLIIFYEWYKHSMGVMLWAVMFIVFTLPHSAHWFSNTYEHQTLIIANSFSIIFMVCYLVVRVVYHRFGANKIVTIKAEDFQNVNLSLLNFLYAIYFVSFAVSMAYFYSRGGSILTVRWSYGGSYPVLEKLANLILVSFSGLGFVALIRKEYFKFSGLLIIYMLNIIITQSRYNIVGFIAPFMVYYLFNDSRKQKIRGVVIGICIVMGVFLLQQYRWLGGLNHALDVGFIKIFQSSIDYMKGGNGEFGLVKAFYYFIENNNDFRDFGEGKGYARLAMLLIPASLIPLKPRDFAIDMYREWFKIDNPGGTMHPTLYGDVYANFGMGGCLMGIFYAGLVTFIDEVILRSKDPTVKILVISLSCTMMVMLARGAVYNSIFNCVAGMIMIAAVVSINNICHLWRKY